MTSDDLYFTADQAADYLGVSKPTLYSYVGRKNIRSLKDPGTRRRLYWREDIERLGGHARPAGRESGTDGLVSETKITLWTDEGLFYRGRDVETLAESASVEAVAALLWEVEEDEVFTSDLPVTPANFGKVIAYSRELNTLSRTAALLPLIEAANPRSYDLSRLGYARTGVDVIRSFSAVIAGSAQFSAEPIHEHVTRALNAPSPYADIIRCMMIFAADHGIDPVTYAVRASANAGVTPYDIVLTGQAVHNGRRLYASRVESVSRIVREIVTATDPTDPILSRFRGGEVLPGFTLKDARTDCRAKPFLETLQRSLKKDKALAKLLAAIDFARELNGAQPEFLMLIAFVSHKLELKDPLSVAGIGRMIGLIAHAMEQYFTHDLYQPHPAYTGELPRAS